MVAGVGVIFVAQQLTVERFPFQAEEEKLLEGLEHSEKLDKMREQMDKVMVRKVKGFFCAEVRCWAGVPTSAAPDGRRA